MDKKLKEMMNEAIRCLNWDIILDYYSIHDYFEIGIKKRKNVTKTHKGVTKDFLIKELKSIITFVIDGGLHEFDHDQWFIIYRNYEEIGKNGLGARLEILFSPTKSVAFESEVRMPDEDTDSTVMERDVLIKLLNKSVTEENYELSAVLRDRIKKVDKLIKDSLQ